MASITKPILLAVIGILAVVLFLQTTNLITGLSIGQNQTVTTGFSSSNIVPTMLSVTLAISDPDQACTTDAAATTCDVLVLDENGVANITGVNGTLSATGFTSACTANDSNCYSQPTCTNYTGGGTHNETADTYRCDFGNLEWYAIDGTWTCTATVSDGTTDATLSNTDSRGKLYALDVQGNIDWPSTTPGSEVQTTTDVRNCGNTLMDTKLNASAMTCAVGTIPVGNIEMGTTVAAGDLVLSTTLTEVETNHGIPVDGGDNQTLRNYWNVTIPTTGISGTCSGTATFSAIEGE